MILLLHTGSVNDAITKSKANCFWQKTQFANLIRYVPSGIYFARIRVKGKLIRKSLKTDVLTVAKLRLADFEKNERQRAESQIDVAHGKLTFGEALAIYHQRILGDVSLKQRTKEYYEERSEALLKSWPGLKTTGIAKISKSECLNWAATFGNDYSPTAFNNTVKILRDVFDIGIERGARYDNPALSIKRASVRPKKLQLPEFSKFNEFIHAIEKSGSRHSKPCADLVRFLAFGGFRITEAANILWQDCDFRELKITVSGDPENRTKNGEIRSVPMISNMVELLNRLKVLRPNARPTDRIMLVRECQKAIDRAAKKVNIHRITHHDLRHLFATRCIESGVDIPTVSRWLGHKDGGALAMKTYGHLRNEHSQAMAQKVKF
jgi:integrase